MTNFDRIIERAIHTITQPHWNPKEPRRQVIQRFMKAVTPHLKAMKIYADARDACPMDSKQEEALDGAVWAQVWEFVGNNATSRHLPMLCIDFTEAQIHEGGLPLRAALARNELIWKTSPLFYEGQDLVTGLSRFCQLAFVYWNLVDQHGRHEVVEAVCTAHATHFSCSN